jgi:hypothetical protein
LILATAYLILATAYLILAIAYYEYRMRADRLRMNDDRLWISYLYLGKNETRVDCRSERRPVLPFEEPGDDFEERAIYQGTG